MTALYRLSCIGLLCILALVPSCTGRSDAKRLDAIVSRPSSVDTLKFSDSSTTNIIYLRNEKAAQFLAALAATNRINAHSWGKGEVVAQVVGTRGGRPVFHISLFEDGVFSFDDYYFKTKTPAPFPN